MGDNLKNKVINVLTALVVTVIIVGGLVLMYPDYQRAESLRRKNEELQHRIDSCKRDIARLKENQQRFRTDADFVESIARQNHRVFPGELVFIFNDR